MNGKYPLLMTCVAIFGIVTYLTGLAIPSSFFFIFPSWLWIPTYSAIGIIFAYNFVYEVRKPTIIGEESK